MERKCHSKAGIVDSERSILHFSDYVFRRSERIIAATAGPAPLDPSELTFLATDTRTPYLAKFDGVDAKKVAHYMLRWESTRGETGPWSETASATIGA